MCVKHSLLRLLGFAALAVLNSAVICCHTLLALPFNVTASVRLLSTTAQYFCTRSTGSTVSVAVRLPAFVGWCSSLASVSMLLLWVSSSVSAHTCLSLCVVLLTTSASTPMQSRPFYNIPLNRRSRLYTCPSLLNIISVVLYCIQTILLPSELHRS